MSTKPGRRAQGARSAKNALVPARDKGLAKRLDRATAEILKLQRTIEESFYKLGLRLREVRDERLYEARYESFEEYLEKEVAKSRETAYRYIRVVETFQEEFALEKGVKKLGSYLRYLKATPEDDGPEDLPKIEISVRSPRGGMVKKKITEASADEIDLAARAVEARVRSGAAPPGEAALARRFASAAFDALDRANLEKTNVTVECSKKHGCHVVAVSNVKLANAARTFGVLARAARGK